MINDEDDNNNNDDDNDDNRIRTDIRCIDHQRYT